MLHVDAKYSDASICVSGVKTMKINLKVNAEFDLDGFIRPTSIVWEDGRTFSVDRILDIRRAASLKAGGLGIRYTCRICGKVVN